MVQEFLDVLLKLVRSQIVVEKYNKDALVTDLAIFRIHVMHIKLKILMRLSVAHIFSTKTCER